MEANQNLKGSETPDALPTSEVTGTGPDPRVVENAVREGISAIKDNGQPPNTLAEKMEDGVKSAYNASGMSEGTSSFTDGGSTTSGPLSAGSIGSTLNDAAASLRTPVDHTSSATDFGSELSRGTGGALSSGSSAEDRLTRGAGLVDQDVGSDENKAAALE